MPRALTLIAVLLCLTLAPRPSPAAPLQLADLAGFGGPDALDAVQGLLAGAPPTHLLARVGCVHLDCGVLAPIDGRIAADLFDVTAVGNGASGSWAFDGLTEWISQNVSRTWYVQYVVIQSNLGTHVANQLFVPVATAGGGAVQVFAGGPVEWVKPHGLSAYPTNHISFYGSAVTAPEPTSLALFGTAAVVALVLHRRRRK